MGREPVVDGVSAFITTDERYWTATIPAGPSNRIGSKPGSILSHILPRHNFFPRTGLIPRISHHSPWANSRVLVLAASFVYELHRYRTLQAMKLFLIKSQPIACVQKSQHDENNTWSNSCGAVVPSACCGRGGCVCEDRCCAINQSVAEPHSGLTVLLMLRP